MIKQIDELQMERRSYVEVMPRVKEILDDVKEGGDLAISKYTERFDGVRLESIEVTEDEVESAFDEVDDSLLSNIKEAADNIFKFHASQKRNEFWVDISQGIKLGQRFIPLSIIGAYVPKSLFSTALMTIIPARVAGVDKIVVCSPPESDGNINPGVLVSAHIAGANRIFKVGGAQAIAALAFGTESVPKVEKIVGPGNVYVTAAKNLVRGDIAIDFLAGPSEIVILADKGDAKQIASDMTAQAEHGAGAIAILLTTSEDLAISVEDRLRNSNYYDRCVIAILDTIEEGIRFINSFAPEHLELIVSDNSVLDKIRNAGSVFMGPYSAVAAGDYATGANHVLPTSGYAKVDSALSVDQFGKYITIQKIDEDGLRNIREVVTHLARAEGLEGHARSIESRLA